MGKLKNRWRAAIITWWLMLWWHWLEASAQNQDSIPEDGKGKIELVSNKTNNELVIDISILDKISKEYQKFKDSKEWQQIINFYGQQEVIENNWTELKEIMQEKKIILENHNPLEYWDSIVKWKINKIIGEISEDIKKNPDKYWTFKTDWTFQIDEETLQDIIQKKTKKEFKDFIKTLPRKSTFFETYWSAFVYWAAIPLLISLIAVAVWLINWNLKRNLFG